MNKNGQKQTRAGGMYPESVDGFHTASVRRFRASPVRSKPTLPTRQLYLPDEPTEIPPAAQPTDDVPAVAPASAPEVKQFPLPRYQAPERPLRPLRKRTSKKKLALRATSLVLVAVLATGGFLTWKSYNKFHKVFHGTGTVAALSTKKVAPQLLKGEGDGRVNILLLGVGGPGHDGADLTDTMVVLSVDPVNYSATMVSVPRDLWVKMPVNYFGSNQKINAAYSSGKYHYLGKTDASSANAQAVEAGFAADDQVLKDVLGININYHLLVNFQAFKQAIDTVGGVTVNVPTDLVDPTMAWENFNNPVIASKGLQTMDGFHALEYARSRETTSDFARAQRQRQILLALKDKVLTAGTLSNPAKVDGLVNAFGDNLFSDLSTQGALRLTSIMKQVGNDKISSIGLSDDNHKLVTTDRVGNLSVVRPVAGFNNYVDIQNYIRGQLIDGFIAKERAGIAVIGPTVPSASTFAATLTGFGYTVSSTDATDQPQTGLVLVDLSGGKNPYTKHYLEERFNVRAVQKLPAGVTLRDGNAKFAIISPK